MSSRKKTHQSLPCETAKKPTPIPTMSNCKKAHQSLPYQTVKRHNDIYRVKPQENTTMSTVSNRKKHNNIYRVKPKKTQQSLPCQIAKNHSNLYRVKPQKACAFLRFDMVEIGVLFYSLTW
jgi:hypothetical protein